MKFLLTDSRAYKVLTASLEFVKVLSEAVSLSSYPIYNVPLCPSETASIVKLLLPSTAETFMVSSSLTKESIALLYLISTFSWVALWVLRAALGLPVTVKSTGNNPVPVNVTDGVFVLVFVVGVRAEPSPFEALPKVQVLPVTVPAETAYPNVTAVVSEDAFTYLTTTLSMFVPANWS